MGFFKDVVGSVTGAFGGGGETATARPTTQPFTIDTGGFGSAQFTPEGRLGAMPGERFRPFIRQAEQQGLGRDILIGSQARSALASLIRQGTGQFRRARELEREAAAITPEAEFGALSALLAPGQERERLALESRLRAQGRLGTTGGAEEARALRTAQGETSLSAAVRAITGARQARAQTREQANQALATALRLTQAGVGGQQQVATQELGIQQGALANLIQLQEAGLRPLTVGGAISGQQPVVTQQAPGFANQFLAQIAANVGQGAGQAAGAAIGGG